MDRNVAPGGMSGARRDRHAWHEEDRLPLPRGEDPFLLSQEWDRPEELTDIPREYRAETRRFWPLNEAWGGGM